jgi:hypothetical protein
MFWRTCCLHQGEVSGVWKQTKIQMEYKRGYSPMKWEGWSLWGVQGKRVRVGPPGRDKRRLCKTRKDPKNGQCRGRFFCSIVL